MNALERISLPDIQSQPDRRDLPIEAVGVKSVRYPVTVKSGDDVVPTIATFAMTVALPGNAKGTHMSRFVELLEAHRDALDQAGFERLVRDMLKRLGAQHGAVEMRFPWFARKAAPVSGAQSLLDYEATWRGAIQDDGQYRFSLHVTVPATSLCPCSKEISQYGAHNQRSHIGIDVELHAAMDMQEVIGIAERSASCQVYGLLKRADEKYVTERAYENPKFVEDLVRDVAAALNQEPRIESFVVEAENFESIHNHSAFARITKPRVARKKAAGITHTGRRAQVFTGEAA
jgi:MptA/FolE2 family GTP cyclohydrolase